MSTAEPTQTTVAVATATSSHQGPFHRAFDWTVHTAEEIETFLKGVSGADLVAAIPAPVKAELEAMLPPVLEAGVQTVASLLDRVHLTVLASYLGATDAAFVQLLLSRVGLSPAPTSTKS